MKNKNNTTTKLKQKREQAKKAKLIKLGIDAHIDRYVVVRQIDGATPQPPQSFNLGSFLSWAEKQLEKAEKVISAYEAGPLGYSLHRELEKMGMTNLVIRPRDWDEYGKKVKTDKRDAKQIVLALDRYCCGNKDAFSVVRVPTEEEERKRSVSRQRQSLQKHKQRLAAQGRSLVMYYGGRLKGQWWKPRQWSRLTGGIMLADFLIDLLKPLRDIILVVEEKLKARVKQIEEAAPVGLPRGMGKQTAEELEREIGDWHRFKTRRQVGSYTGLCPSEDSSAQRRFQGSINKHGNRRVRTLLIECAWRLVFFQPDYQAVRRWLTLLLDVKTTKAKRKKIIVALARQFVVDWWKIKTNRCRPEELGLELMKATN